MRSGGFPGTWGRPLSPGASAKFVFAFCSLTPGGFHHDRRCVQRAHVGAGGLPDLAGLLRSPAADGPRRAEQGGEPASRRPESAGVENGAGRVPTRGSEPSQAAPAGGAGERLAWAGVGGTRTSWSTRARPDALNTSSLEIYLH